MTSVVTSIHNFKQESLFRIKACRGVVFCETGSSLASLHLSRILYKSALFMQNKPNFQKAKMNVNIYYTKVYKNETVSGSGKNKPNSNPNKPNLRKAQMNVNLYFIEYYRKKDDFSVRINKPNSKPISSKAKMNANSLLTMDYDNVTDFRLQKNKPKTNPIKVCPERIYTELCRSSRMGQSFVKDFIALVNAWMFISKTIKKSCARLWALLQCFRENFDKPGEPKTKGKFRLRLRIPHLLSIGSSLIGAGDPTNLLGIMPAKEGKMDLKHSFLSAVADYGSAFCFEFYKTEPRP